MLGRVLMGLGWPPGTSALDGREGLPGLPDAFVRSMVVLPSVKTP